MTRIRTRPEGEKRPGPLRLLALQTVSRSRGIDGSEGEKWSQPQDVVQSPTNEHGTRDVVQHPAILRGTVATTDEKDNQDKKKAGPLATGRGPPPNHISRDPFCRWFKTAEGVKRLKATLRSGRCQGRVLKAGPPRGSFEGLDCRPRTLGRKA